MKGYTKKMVKAAIPGTGGIMAAIAKKLGCKWDTAQRYVQKYNLQQDILNEKETMLDLAESKLMANVNSGDNASIFFFLKTQGKGRGYIESQIVQFDKNASIHVRHDNDED